MKTNYSMQDLFDQLGLDNDGDSIDSFITKHQLPRKVTIESAAFWKPHQIDFIVSAKADDADWSDAVDDLDALLHKDSMKKKSGVLGYRHTPY